MQNAQCRGWLNNSLSNVICVCVCAPMQTHKHTLVDTLSVILRNALYLFRQGLSLALEPIN